MPDCFDFGALASAIHQVHEHLARQAGRAINISLTLRNWLIGCYIREYEQRGEDRAQYGQDLLNRLSRRLKEDGTLSYHPRELGRCREFYLVYPQIWGTLSPKWGAMLPAPIQEMLHQNPAIASPTGIQGTPSPESGRLLESLSFSHFSELIPIEDLLKRAFYEIECIRGCWSVRELKRQIGSLAYERSGLSTDKEKLASMIHANAEKVGPEWAIRDPYVFEFLGLQPREVMREADLENALLDKLQDFLLELGHGFCFEARQKRLVIGEEHFFVDLVFYHRILKCHVLIELKNNAFKHEHLGQLNAYVSYYRKHQMVEGDHPPIGILLCTRKNHEMVEFALSGMNNTLFVSRYQLELPAKEEIAAFLHRALMELEGGDA